jgi:hypothetical protein
MPSPSTIRWPSRIGTSRSAAIPIGACDQHAHRPTGGTVILPTGQVSAS